MVRSGMERSTAILVSLAAFLLSLLLSFLSPLSSTSLILIRHMALNDFNEAQLQLSHQ